MTKELSLRQIAKHLGVSHTLLSLWKQGKRNLSPDLEAKFLRFVTTGYKNGYNFSGQSAMLNPQYGVDYLVEPATRQLWRECEGVEPTAPTAGLGPTDLKSARPTGTHPLPLST